MASCPLALRFLALTAVRASEAAGARWDEIDGDTWTIPPGRMKAGRAHQVPLSPAALAVLQQARGLAIQSEFVFPGRGAGGVNPGALRNRWVRMRLRGVPHGLRTSFRRWCQDAGHDREVAEACLAHRTGNRVEQAYARSTMLERRRDLMVAWAKYMC